LTVYKCNAPKHWACRIERTTPTESCGQCPKIEVREEKNTMVTFENGDVELQVSMETNGDITFDMEDSYGTCLQFILNPHIAMILSGVINAMAEKGIKG
jgi:hypothetical protein